MFGRKAPQQVEHVNVTRIELSDESRQALVSLDNDIQTLREFMREVSDKASSILSTLHGEIVMQVPTYTAPEPEIGVKVFEDEGRVELPGVMGQNDPEDARVTDEARIRATPFTRAPRHTQVAWLQRVMADGAWYPPIVIAREYATDERHLRYMKGALTARLREMHEEAIVERRDSHVKGSMFEYRLVMRSGQ
jgi:hypothetical protein